MTKDNLKTAWGRVGDELSGLGLKLKLHVQEEFADESDDEVKDALEKLSEAIDDAVEAVENIAKDPAVRDDLRKTGTELMNAINATVDEARSSFRTSADKTGSD